MSIPRIDDRLARLAPTSSPDPEGLAAARAAVFDAAVEDRTGSRRGRVHERTQVVDLHDESLDDVVAPLGAARRRNRHLGVAAAAAGAVGVISVGLVLLPGEVGFVPASPGATCGDQLVGNLGLQPETAEELTWRTVASESGGTADTTLLVLDGGGVAGVCSDVRGDGGTTTSTTTWSLPGAEPAADEILPRGVTSGPAPVVWGVAGAGVDSVDVALEWSDDGGSMTGDSGVVVEARMTDDGYWSAFFSPEDRVPQDAAVALTWRLADGTEGSMSLDEAWPGVDATTPLAEARREECPSGSSSSGLRPVFEEVRDEVGVTLLGDGVRRTVLCAQDADPPYTQRLTSGGTASAPAPAADEAVADSGGGGGHAAALVGRAGEDVARVEVTTTDGLSLDAEVVDGYWMVWVESPAASDDNGLWQDATLRWHLTDGSPGGAGTVFG
ncbi:hypothetical protein UQW22_07520 [Isoptericola halotolerans]|uniref:hypothetical protein n=1 Tax=Isoptericola halotolerans TaxID=300560 RepID=UPI0038900987